MQSPKKKLLVALLFLAILLLFGYWLSTRIGTTSIKKQGYRTKIDPNYIDSFSKSKQKK